MSFCKFDEDANNPKQLGFTLQSAWTAYVIVQFMGASQKRVIIHGTDGTNPLTKTIDACSMTTNPSTDSTYIFTNYGTEDKPCHIEVKFVDSPCSSPPGTPIAADAGIESFQRTSAAIKMSNWAFNFPGKSSVQITVVIVDNAGGGGEGEIGPESGPGHETVPHPKTRPRGYGSPLPPPVENPTKS